LLDFDDIIFLEPLGLGRDMDSCVTVEVLPLDPPEEFVKLEKMEVKDVNDCLRA
jgi:hypothetical protein